VTGCVCVADKPGKTGTPTVEDVDEDSVKLSWTPPKTDGGDKVKGYVIEAKEKGSDKWRPLNAKSPCKDTKFTGTPAPLKLRPYGAIQICLLLLLLLLLLHVLLDRSAKPTLY